MFRVHLYLYHTCTCIKFGAFVSVALSVGNSVVRTTVPNLDFMSLKIFLLLILGAVSNRIFTSDILELKYVKIACLDAVVAALLKLRLRKCC